MVALQSRQPHQKTENDCFHLPMVGTIERIIALHKKRSIEREIFLSDSKQTF